MNARLANRRIRLLVAVFAIVFAGALVRAGWLQAVQAPTLDRLAADQYRETIAIPAHRGTIYDRNGVELAVGARATTVYANPRQIVDPRAAAVVAGKALDLDADELAGLLADRSKGFVYVARKADPERAAELEREKLPGLGFYDEERRTYPQATVGSGDRRLRRSRQQGAGRPRAPARPGLAGREGSKTIVRDPSGRTLGVVRSTPVVDGSDVYLSVDHVLQAELERVLRRTRERWGALSATGVVLDPETGGILAMAVEPGYDANTFPDVDEELRRNRAITDTYEPGSTMKVVTISAELERGDVKPSTTVHAASDDPGLGSGDLGARSARHRDDDRLPDPRRVVERRHGDARASARQAPPVRVGLAVRVRQGDRHRLPRGVDRDRAAARGVVGLDDRYPPDRARHRRDARADGGGVRRSRQRRSVGSAAPRRTGRGRRGRRGRRAAA